jgi:hypothetical protein
VQGSVTDVAAFAADGAPLDGELEPEPADRAD